MRIDRTNVKKKNFEKRTTMCTLKCLPRLSFFIFFYFFDPSCRSDVGTRVGNFYTLLRSSVVQEVVPTPGNIRYTCIRRSFEKKIRNYIRVPLSTGSVNNNWLLTPIHSTSSPCPRPVGIDHDFWPLFGSPDPCVFDQQRSIIPNNNNIIINNTIVVCLLCACFTTCS